MIDRSNTHRLLRAMAENLEDHVLPATQGGADVSRLKAT